LDASCGSRRAKRPILHYAERLYDFSVYFAFTYLTSTAPARLRCLRSALLLTHRFEQDNCHGSRKVQAARSAHRDRDATVDVGREQSLGQPPCFSTENEKIIWSERHIVISPLRLRRQKKITCIGRLPTLQVIERIPKSHVHFIPIIEACPFQVRIVKGKPERLY
jgi:hypothetical protein